VYSKLTTEIAKVIREENNAHAFTLFCSLIKNAINPVTSGNQSSSSGNVMYVPKIKIILQTFE
jgi:hypothetical protein